MGSVTKVYNFRKKLPHERMKIAIGGEKLYDTAHVAEQKVIQAETPLPSPTPLPDEEEIRRAQRRLVASRAGRTGRQSTILTGDDEPLG